MSSRTCVYALVLMALAGCNGGSSSHEKALQLWESNFETAERLVESGDAGPELQRVQEFFWRVAGLRGLIVAHTFDNLTVSPQAHSTLRKLRQWCNDNCEHLAIDSDSGEVVFLETESPP